MPIEYNRLLKKICYFNNIYFISSLRIIKLILICHSIINISFKYKLFLEPIPGSLTLISFQFDFEWIIFPAGQSWSQLHLNDENKIRYWQQQQQQQNIVVLHNNDAVVDDDGSLSRMILQSISPFFSPYWSIIHWYMLSVGKINKFRFHSKWKNV